VAVSGGGRGSLPSGRQRRNPAGPRRVAPRGTSAALAGRDVTGSHRRCRHCLSQRGDHLWFLPGLEGVEVGPNRRVALRMRRMTLMSTAVVRHNQIEKGKDDHQ